MILKTFYIFAGFGLYLKLTGQMMEKGLQVLGWLDNFVGVLPEYIFFSVQLS
jgi:hypothetical protein